MAKTNHRKTALDLLADCFSGDWDEPMRAILVAQVHATLALVEELARFTESYNGWKDIGK